MKKIAAIILLVWTSQVTGICQSNESAGLSFQKLKNEVSSISLPAKPTISLEASGKKNVALAILFSALLPGMGELYAQNYESGKYFTIADAALLGVYFGVDTYGNWKKENYKSFAKSFGGVTPSNKNDDYFATIGNYMNIDQYNDEKAFEGRFTELFNKSSMNWNWETETQRREYRGMWLSSQRAYNNLQFVVGAMLINRLASIINAVRSVVAYNKNISAQTSWNIYMQSDPNPVAIKNISLNFISSF